MRIAVGALLYEGNTFSLSRSDIDQFERNYLFEGDEILSRLRGGDVEVSGAIEVLDGAGAQILPLIATHGGCGGMVTKDCFETLKSRLIARLRDTRPDGVFLALHGAMICEGIDDAEAELLREVRSTVGSVPIVISCDLHAHISPAMMASCDAIVGYQQYPHDDTFETGVRATGLLVKAVAGEVSLTMAMTKLAMLVPPTGTREKTVFRDLYKACRALETLPGVLSLSYFPSTPWAEREEGGTAFVIVTDGKNDDAECILNSLARRLWGQRERLSPHLDQFADAIAATRDTAGPIILSEMSDAVGAGAAGDSAYVLNEYLRMGEQGSFLVQIVDPEVVTLAAELGAGAEIDCALGNKVETRYGAPVRFQGRVAKVIEDGVFTYRAGLMGGITSTIGAAAILSRDNVTVLVSSRPAYEYADEQFAAVGLDVRTFKYVVVKNPMNYRQAYSWAPRLFALDTPGAGRVDLKQLPWVRCRRPFFPLDDSQEPIVRGHRQVASL